MLLAKRNYIQLKVQLNEQVRIIPVALIPELAPTSKTIAKSIEALLRLHLKYNQTPNQKDAVIKYLEQRGWHVEPEID